MERSITEELAELLKEKNVDFMTLSKLYEEKDFKDLKARYNLKCSAKTIEKTLKPHLGDVLEIRKGSPSKCLTFKLPDEVLLFRIVEKSQGKKPKATGMPFNKAKYLELMNQLLERGMIRVQFNTKYEPLLYAAGTNPLTPTHIEPIRGQVTEEAFHAAFSKLERGQLFVDIYELRRLLNWSKEDFDAMLRKLRKAGKIQLNEVDTTIMGKDEIEDSFVDENFIRMGTVRWQ